MSNGTEIGLLPTDPIDETTLLCKIRSDVMSGVMTSHGFIVADSQGDPLFIESSDANPARPRFVVKENGMIGIGTSTPQSSGNQNSFIQSANHSEVVNNTYTYYE